MPRKVALEHHGTAMLGGDPLAEQGAANDVLSFADPCAKVETDGACYVDMASQRSAVPHGLRSTFRVWATEQGYDHRMAEIALAHWQGDETERAY